MIGRPDQITHVYYGEGVIIEWSVQMLIDVLTENFAPADVITVLDGPTRGITISVRRQHHE